MSQTVETPIAVQLISLEAAVRALEGGIQGTEAAITQLQGRNDPDSIGQLMTLLLDRNRIEEAASVARRSPYHQKTCLSATAALTRVGSLTEAEQVVKWSRANVDINVANRCALMFAQL